jgi:diguanylate cyclase (GGDEF)-like protein
LSGLPSFAEAPQPSTGSVEGASLDPYGQLIRMLLPRAQSIVVYDRMGQALWTTPGGDDLELKVLQQDLHTREMAQPGVTGDGCSRTLPGEQSAYLFVLRDSSRAWLGAIGVNHRESLREPRPFLQVHALVRPLLHCLERELLAQGSLGVLQRDLALRDRDFELLIGAARDEASGADSSEDYARLVQSWVDHLGCSVGALLIPDKNIAVCRAGQGVPPRAAAELLTRTHRQLIGWAQLHRTSMTTHGPLEGSPIPQLPYKVLSCPVMHGSQAQGVLVLYRPMAAPDFDLRHVRIVELLARRVAYILMNAYDPGTGLLTRPAFEKRAQALLTEEALERGRHCVIYIDIDRLHLLNENLGMHVGDEAITRVADAIRGNLSPHMLASRISGDRFAILVPDARLEATQDIAENLRASLERIALVRDNRTVEITASFGVAVIQQGVHALSHALASAEIACKAAKDRGRNRVETYAESDQSIVRRYTDITLVGTVRSALMEHRFRLEAQPIVPLNGAPDVPKFELLLRMHDEAGQGVPPDKFLSAAERYQLAPAIDRWVVRRTLEILKPLAAALQERKACFAVNISGQSLGDADFASFIDGTLRESGLPLELLSFELTETAAVANIVRAETLIRRLRELGCAVALDDFGRGLSSLTYLKTLPVTHLKIDGIFVRDVNSDERSLSMLSAIVQLARAVNLRTVAECVESDAILQATRSLGVDYGQGYALGRPAPLENVLTGLVAANMVRPALLGTA